MGISALAWGEFLCGPLSPAAEILARRLLPNAHPLERVDAEKAAGLFNLTGRRSKSYADCCIAAVAIRAQAAPVPAIEVISPRWCRMDWCWPERGNADNSPVISNGVGQVEFLVSNPPQQQFYRIRMR